MDYKRHKRQEKLAKHLREVLNRTIAVGVRDYQSELDALWLAANEWAVQFEDEGLNMVTAGDIAKIDALAAGHVDWHRKLCWRTAELVYEENHETSD